jgi:hypothetical protein
MAHYPLNHHLRPVYRFLTALCALYLTVFGVVGIGTTWGDEFFHRGHDWVIGLRTNPAAAWIAAVIGIILLAAVLIGGNLLHRVSVLVGWVLFAYAFVTMAFLQTSANIVNGSMINVIALLLIGLVTLTCGLYAKVGSPDAASAEEAAAHPH